MDGVNYFDKCNLLNSNPVFIAHHFQHRVETLFKEIELIPISILGKVTFNTIKIEFEVRGSLHVDSFLWILSAPKLTEDNTNLHRICRWSDTGESLVKLYQVYLRSRSYRKYKKPCRYILGKFFTSRNIFAVPLDSNTPEYERYSITSKRDLLLVRLAILSTYFLVLTKRQ